MNKTGQHDGKKVKATYRYLLHIICGYQCDKAVNKNDTREAI